VLVRSLEFLQSLLKSWKLQAMNNQNWMAVALIVIGIIGVNFFYVSDLLMGSDVIRLGTKSLIAIGGANLIALSGAWMIVRNH